LSAVTKRHLNPSFWDASHFLVLFFITFCTLFRYELNLLEV